MSTLYRSFADAASLSYLAFIVVEGPVRPFRRRSPSTCPTASLTLLGTNRNPRVSPAVVTNASENDNPSQNAPSRPAEIHGMSLPSIRHHPWDYWLKAEHLESTVPDRPTTHSVRARGHSTRFGGFMATN
ncbi:hypothetical protein BC828DRAFT_402843 [Blastocladiella britannica]|nr:hypothetical protein BC828DRAFT_402843 [Blastocladiella britannica]